jgi:oligopeptide transport system permease protein
MSNRNSLWSDAWRRLAKNRMALTSLVTFGILVVACFAAPLIGSLLGVDATTINTDIGATPPSNAHWFGTDTLGRDMMMRTLSGGQIAITVAVISTAVALVIGVTWGAIAAYAGGKVDFVMMRIVDVLYGFPTVAFVIVIMAVLSTTSLFALYAFIGAISWLTMARIVRGAVLSLRNREFVEAARAIGASTSRILFRHILPNASGPIIVYATLSLPAVMLTEAFLSFLGLGVRAPLASWGTLVTEGSSQILVYPWMLAFPSVTMAVAIVSLNFLGDGLRDALDPRENRKS